MVQWAVLLAVLLSLSDGAIVKYEWTITNTTQAPDGVSRWALGINGQPGHKVSIDVNEGDTVHVQVKNGLLVPTSIHWHGMFQHGTTFMDGPASVTQCPIQPGHSYLYEFSTAGQGAGTYWWHAHYRAQYIDGLRGPFIIHPMDTSSPKEFVVQLADWYHEQSETLLATYQNGRLNPNGNEPVMDIGLINGHALYNCTFAPAGMPCATLPDPYAIFTSAATSVIKLRIINMAAFAGFRFTVDGHTMRVVAVDGTDVASSNPVQSLTINIAQRYDVIISLANSIGNYWMRSTMFHGSPWTSAEDPPGFQVETRAILNYLGADINTMPTTSETSDPDDPMIDVNDIALVPVLVSHPPNSTLNLAFEFGFERRGSDTYQKAYPLVYRLEDTSNVIVNGSYTVDHEKATLIRVAAGKPVPADQQPIIVEFGQVVQLTLINYDGGEHPFHLHGHKAWVMARGTAANLNDVPQQFHLNMNPTRRDTFSIVACPQDDNGCLPAPSNSTSQSQFGYVVIRWVADNPGIWLLHCHIEWHIAAGLVVTFIEAPDHIAAAGLPETVLSNCGIPSASASTTTATPSYSAMAGIILAALVIATAIAAVVVRNFTSRASRTTLMLAHASMIPPVGASYVANPFSMIVATRFHHGEMKSHPGETPQCTICGHVMAKGCRFVKLQCSHMFHEKCITEMLGKATCLKHPKRCPVCKVNPFSKVENMPVCNCNHCNATFTPSF